MMGGWLEMMILPIILIIAFIYIVYNQRGNNKFKHISIRDNSLNILNERFAPGDIDEEEYNIKK